MSNHRVFQAALIAATCAMVSNACIESGSNSAAAATRHIYKGRISQGVASADRLMLKGKYDAAATTYRAAMKANPHDANAAVGLGVVLGKQFKLDAADQQLDKVLAKDPSNPGAHAGKALVMLNRLQSSSNTIRKNKDTILKEAESEAKKALDEDNGMPEAHYAMGMVYKEQGRLPDAMNELNKAIQLDKNYGDGYTGRGMIKIAMNNPGAATSDFKQAIRLNSGDFSAHYGMGQALLNQGQVDAALKELNTAQYQFPNSWPVRLALGKAFETQGNTVAAVREYQESIRIKPENPAAYLGIANVREVRGDVEHSIAELRSGLELMPDNADLRVRIGEQSLRVDKFGDAIKEFETVMATSPGNSRAADGLTTAYYMKAQKETTGGYFGDNDFDNALAMVQKAVQMNPNDMRLRLAQAKLRALSGEPVDLAGLGQPQSDGDRVSYAQLLMAQNRFREAAVEMQTVISRAPNAKQTFAIADLALMTHDLDSAEAAYRKAASYPGSAERSRRGLGQVTKSRESARKNLTLATDLHNKRMTGSAVDTYHDAVFSNPRSSDARLGLAKTLESVSKPTPVQRREAAFQYRAYVSLTPTLAAKEQEKFLKKADKLDVKATRSEQKSVAGN